MSSTDDHADPRLVAGVERGELVSADDRADGAIEPVETVSEPAKVMRIGSDRKSVV